MTNIETDADQMRTSEIPWNLGQSSIGDIINLAARQAKSFAVDLGGALARVELDGRWVGYADPDSLSIIRWPSIHAKMTDRDHREYLHRVADSYETFAQCYFIGASEGPVKIGYSVDVEGRLRVMRAHSPLPLGILATAPGGISRECAYHFQFAAHRLHGEWFERHPDILAEIARLSPKTVEAVS